MAGQDILTESVCKDSNRNKAHSKGVEGIRAGLEAALIDPVEETPKHSLTRLSPVHIDFHDPHSPVPNPRVIVEDNGSQTVLQYCLP